MVQDAAISRNKNDREPCRFRVVRRTQCCDDGRRGNDPAKLVCVDPEPFGPPLRIPYGGTRIESKPTPIGVS